MASEGRPTLTPFIGKRGLKALGARAVEVSLRVCPPQSKITIANRRTVAAMSQGSPRK